MFPEQHRQQELLNGPPSKVWDAQSVGKRPIAVETQKRIQIRRNLNIRNYEKARPQDVSRDCERAGGEHEHKRLEVEPSQVDDYPLTFTQTPCFREVDKKCGKTN